MRHVATAVEFKELLLGTQTLVLHVSSTNCTSVANMQNFYASIQPMYPKTIFGTVDASCLGDLNDLIPQPCQFFIDRSRVVSTFNRQNNSDLFYWLYEQHYALEQERLAAVAMEEGEEAEGEEGEGEEGEGEGEEGEEEGEEGEEGEEEGEEGEGEGEEEEEGEETEEEEEGEETEEEEGEEEEETDYEETADVVMA